MHRIAFALALAASPTPSIVGVAPRCASGLVRASAPTVLASLVPRWREAAARAGIMLGLPPAFGPPQGALDPALEDFLEGRRDVAFLSRELAERDLAAFHSFHLGGDLVVVPVAAGAWNRFGDVDAVVVIVNRANPIRALSFTQIDALFSATHVRSSRPIVTWGDLGLRGAWRDRKVAIAGGGAWRGDESARALTIRRNVLSLPGRPGRWRDLPSSGSESNVVADVGRDPAAIGFTGMGHLDESVRAVAIGPDAGDPIRLTAASALAGRYPLLRKIDLLVPIDAHGRPGAAALRLAAYLVSPQGQRIVKADAVFSPLPAPDLVRARMIVRHLADGRDLGLTGRCQLPPANRGSTERR